MSFFLSFFHHCGHYRRGPFVMNTEQEIRQAFQDYYSGNFAQVPAVFHSKAHHDKEYHPADGDASIV